MGISLTQSAATRVKSFLEKKLPTPGRSNEAVSKP